MFVPPEHRRSWHPPQPEGDKSRRGETVLLVLIGLFLLAMLLAPIGGSGVVQALLALLGR
jgi:hypothetical protein